MNNFINFFCVGAQKSGTTTLYNILKQHPQIFLPKTKEAHFFDDDNKFKLGIDWYYNNFYKDYNKEKICGSCNPEYIYFEEVPKRIYEAFGSDIKLIFILRNPADRAYSHYLMTKRRCIETLSFEEAIKNEKSRIQIDYSNKSNFSYLSRGFYYKQIKRYLQFFPKKNMMFIRFEDDFISEKSRTINEIFEFLDIDRKELNLNIKSNVAKSSKYFFIQKFIYKENYLKSFVSFFVSQRVKNYIRRFLYKLFMKAEKNNILDPKLKNKLINYYEEDINKLEKLIGKNLLSWKN